MEVISLSAEQHLNETDDDEWSESALSYTDGVSCRGWRPLSGLDDV